MPDARKRIQAQCQAGQQGRGGRLIVVDSVAAEKPGVALNDPTEPQACDPITGNVVLNGPCRR